MNEFDLKNMIEQRFGNVRAFAQEADVPYTTMRSILERGLMNAKAENVFKICATLRIKPEDLSPINFNSISNPPSPTFTALQIQDVVNTLDEDPHQKNVLRYANKEKLKQSETGLVEELFAYNYYDQPASAGTGQYLNDINAETIQLPLNVDADFVIPIKGDSMEPDFQDGDYVFVKLSVELADGTVGVFEYDKEAYIKQLLIGSTSAWLHSFNDEYPDIEINTDNGFRIIGAVVGKYRATES